MFPKMRENMYGDIGTSHYGIILGLQAKKLVTADNYFEQMLYVNTSLCIEYWMLYTLEHRGIKTPFS